MSNALRWGVAVAVMTVMAPAVASAENLYAAIRGGPGWTQDSLDGSFGFEDTTQYKTGFTGGAALGYVLPFGFRAEEIHPGARILHLAGLGNLPRQQHLNFDADERGRHLEELTSDIQAELLNPPHCGQELRGDLRDGNIENVDVLLANQMQQQLERSREPVDLD